MGKVKINKMLNNEMLHTLLKLIIFENYNWKDIFKNVNYTTIDNIHYYIIIILENNKEFHIFYNKKNKDTNNNIIVTSKHESIERDAKILKKELLNYIQTNIINDKYEYIKLRS